jgi:hypothetical protein
MKSEENYSRTPSPRAEEEAESVYDQFAEIKFDNEIMQKCWLTLGELFYHYEATDFLDPITEERFGKDIYEDYCSVINDPMDISTVIERMKSNYYMDERENRAFEAKDLFI